jgi:hypothetical protein
MLRSSTSSSSPKPSRARGLLLALATLAALVIGDRVPLEPLTGNVAGERVPYRVEIHELDPVWVAGVGPRSRHAANGQGLRGDVIIGRDFEVLLVGGSTTECSLLDEPASLAGALASALEREPADASELVRVASLAQPGLPLAQLLEELEIFTADHRRPDVLIAFVGANEAQTFFNHASWVASAPGPIACEACSGETGGPQRERGGTAGAAPAVLWSPTVWEAWIDPASPFGVEGRAETYRGWYRPGNHGRFLDAPRRAYADARGWQASLHPGHAALLRQSLREYVASLTTLERLAAERDAVLVLATQPVAPWAPPGDGRGWAPFIYAEPGHGFVPSPDLTWQLVDAFNTQTRGFAREHGLALVDLASELSGCVTCFYDQWHFTDEGSREAATRISQALASQRPRK